MNYLGNEGGFLGPLLEALGQQARAQAGLRQTGAVRACACCRPHSKYPSLDFLVCDARDQSRASPPGCWAPGSSCLCSGSRLCWRCWLDRSGQPGIHGRPPAPCGRDVLLFPLRGCQDLQPWVWLTSAVCVCLCLSGWLGDDAQGWTQRSLTPRGAGCWGPHGSDRWQEPRLGACSQPMGRTEGPSCWNKL